MNQDRVNIALDSTMKEIDSAIKQLNEEGASSFKNAEYDKIKKLGHVGDELRKLRVKLEQLKAKWNRGFDATIRRRVKSDRSSVLIPSHGRKAKTILAITFPDGTKIRESFAAKSFVRAIETLGIEKVKQLEIMVCGVPLIAAQRGESYKESQMPCGKFFVMTHSNTKSKMELLHRIAKKLGVKLRVEIEEVKQ